MNSGERRGLSISMLFSDPLRKLASIALAIVLWHLLDNQITKERELRLRLETVSSASHPGERKKLLVTVDSERYFVEGFYDRKTERRISDVRLTLVGANILIDTLNENPGFRVTPTIEDEESTSVSVEFTIADIRPIEPKFQPLFEEAELEPASIRVQLIRNDSAELALDTDQVRIDSSQQTARRLLTDSAEFTPGSVIVLGPADRIEQLQTFAECFKVDISDPRPGETEVQGTLQIIEDPRLSQVKFAGQPPIIRIPLAVDFEKHTVSVPYFVDDRALPRDQWGQFVGDQEAAEVDVEVGNALALEFGNMNADDIQNWFRTYARLWVWLPPNPKDPDVYEPQLHFYGGRYKEGLDYRLIDRKPLHVSRKK